MTTSRYDMLYGRQGGRIVPFAPDAHELDRSCVVCGGPMVNTDADAHRDCAPDLTPAPADEPPTLFEGA